VLPAPNANPQTTAYIAALPPCQAEAAAKIRELIHQAADDVEETIKFTNRPYFTNAGRNLAALLGAKEHLNVFIYDLINQGHGNATARAIQIREGDSLNEVAFVELIRAVAANNRAGGWRKLKG
jgi:hypothetical protein